MKTMPVTVQGKSVVPPSVAITRTVLPHGWCSTVVVELAPPGCVSATLTVDILRRWRRDGSRQPAVGHVQRAVRSRTVRDAWMDGHSVRAQRDSLNRSVLNEHGLPRHACHLRYLSHSGSGLAKYKICNRRSASHVQQSTSGSWRDRVDCAGRVRKCGRLEIC